MSYSGSLVQPAPPKQSLNQHLRDIIRTALDAHSVHCLSHTSRPDEHDEPNDEENTWMDRMLGYAAEVRDAEQFVKRAISRPISADSPNASIRKLEEVEDLRHEGYDFLDHVDEATGSISGRALSFARDFEDRLTAFEKDIDRHLLAIGHEFNSQGQSDLDRIASRGLGGVRLSGGGGSFSASGAPTVQVLRSQRSRC